MAMSEAMVMFERVVKSKVDVDVDVDRILEMKLSGSG